MAYFNCTNLTSLTNRLINYNTAWSIYIRCVVISKNVFFVSTSIHSIVMYVIQGDLLARGPTVSAVGTIYPPAVIKCACTGRIKTWEHPIILGLWYTFMNVRKICNILVFLKMLNNNWLSVQQPYLMNIL